MSISKEEEAIFKALLDKATADCVLPKDPMISILTRLPAKSIQRFKVVSKPWCELFSNPNFKKMHKGGQFSIDPNNESVIINMYYKNLKYLVNIDSDENLEPSILHLPHFYDGEYVTILGCCNGLIFMLYTRLKDVVLCNPAMEMFQRVPLSEEAGRLDSYGAYKVSLGLGYDAGGDDFKLVVIVSIDEGDDEGTSRAWLAEVYSVNSGAWTAIAGRFEFGVATHSLVTVNGNPYWDAFVDPEGDDALVYFDVKSLDFKIVPLPPSYSSERMALVDWNGALGYLQPPSIREKTDSYAEVWVFEDTWRLKDTLGPIKAIVYSFAKCLRNGNILVYKDGKCCVYDPQSGCVKEIKTVGDVDYRFEVYGYTTNFARRLEQSF